MGITYIKMSSYGFYGGPMVFVVAIIVTHYPQKKLGHPRVEMAHKLAIELH